ncbi:MAG: glutathione synthase [Spirulinaceae cyanobacterium RM2_2_10]|nr:glutathione synthase [Spirulinaceae cyanobacterium SM2_1_0]NJO20494.1 glutathione synthase [Spirulinaceae cyanobacterium RM2_2_10]
MNFAFILDPLAKLDAGHDSSVAIMEAAQQAGHQLWVTQVEQLSARDGQVWAQLQPVTVIPVTLGDGHWLAADPWYEVGTGGWQSLAAMDVVFMRKDPPVTINYIYATQLLDLLTPTKTLVINHPRSLQAANEKLYALNFPSVIPQTIVTQDKTTILEFVEAQGAAVLKPLDGKGGEGILFLEPGDRNLNSLLEISTHWGNEWVMVQQYLPAAKDGDKRIILLDGEPIGAVNRIPTGREFRGNMAVGGRVAAVPITDRDREICATVAPRLRADRLYFVGLDVIGGYLTEVNVTSPTGIREIDRLSQVSLGEQIVAWVAAKLKG